MSATQEVKRNPFLAAAVLVSLVATPLTIGYMSTRSVAPEPAPAPVATVVPVIHSNEVSVLKRERNIEVGELVKLNEAGEAIDWLFIPEVGDFYVRDDRPGECVASFRQAGAYIVIASVLNEGAVQTYRWDINVAAGMAANEWAVKFSEWGIRPGEQYAAFAVVFRETANELKAAINEGVLLAPEEILTRLASRAQSLPPAQWAALKSRLVPEFKRLEAAGELTSVNDYVRNFNDIAQAFDPQ